MRRSERLSGAKVKARLTHGYLCMGTFLAAEQAWHLLHDANFLYGQERYANSLVLSVYSVEEVGRSRIYLEQTEQVLQGRVITLEDVKARCKVHMEKLEHGRSPLTVHASTFLQGEPPSPGSVEESQLAHRLQELRRAREKAAPKETHDKRFRALYVDPIDAVKEWNIPAKTEAYDAWDMLYVAGIEYEVHRSKLNRFLGEKAEFQEIASRVRLPKLPEPISLPDLY